MSEFTEQELERVTRKIKHCLALSSSANEHEAAAALRQAQAMMRKYRLTESDVHLSDVGKAESEIVQAKRPAWDVFLAGVVAKAFHCSVLEKSTWCKTALKKRVQAAFVGVSPAQEVACYAYETLRFKVMTDRQAYMAQIRAGEIALGRFTPETRANHFALAWVTAVRDKLQALVPASDDAPIPDAPQDNAAPGYDPERPDQPLSERDTSVLVRSEAKHNELIEEFMLQLNDGKGVGKKRELPKKKANNIDIEMGTKAGNDVELHHGVTTGGKQQLALGGEGVL